MEQQFQAVGKAMLLKVREMRLCDIGWVGAWVLASELYGWRTFRNRREVGGALGLTPTPYSSGDEREQGISKAGNATIIKAITDAGMMCTMQTGARHFTTKRIREAVEAGVQAVGVSVDGLRDLHDRLRSVPGSFDSAFNVLRKLREHGVVTSVNTQITSLVVPQLRQLMELFIDAGAKNWQVQLTVAMGRAADNPALLLQPFRMLELMPLLARLYQDAAPRGLLVQPGNNVGYFGPYESILRASGDELYHWNGCTAGRNAIGIESDGSIKGCPSLPMSPYVGGNIRDMTREDIWDLTPELSFAHSKMQNELWGYCRTCGLRLALWWGVFMSLYKFGP
ncbi:MAG: transposase [Gammaproteobacteria bacterium]